MAWFMKKQTLLSIIESPMHPNYTDLYQQKGLSEIRVNSIRKAINLVKKQPVDYIVAEFFYAYSTNYSGVHKSNLDVLLVSLKKYSPATRVIVLVEKGEKQYVDVLEALDYPLHALLVHPLSRQRMTAALSINQG